MDIVGDDAVVTTYQAAVQTALTTYLGDSIKVAGTSALMTLEPLVGSPGTRTAHGPASWCS